MRHVPLFLCGKYHTFFQQLHGSVEVCHVSKTQNISQWGHMWLLNHSRAWVFACSYKMRNQKPGTQSNCPLADLSFSEMTINEMNTFARNCLYTWCLLYCIPTKHLHAGLTSRRDFVDTKAPPPNAEQAAVEAIRWEESEGRKQVL